MPPGLTGASVQATKNSGKSSRESLTQTLCDPNLPALTPLTERYKTLTLGLQVDTTLPNRIISPLSPLRGAFKAFGKGSIPVYKPTRRNETKINFGRFPFLFPGCGSAIDTILRKFSRFGSVNKIECGLQRY